MISRQFTCVAIGNSAILIDGAPGSGKSSLALALIDRGAKLIGDDSVSLCVRDGRLFATPHPETRGLIEVRNIGLVPFTVLDEAEVSILIRLDAQAPRFIDSAQSMDIEGVGIPWVALWPDSPNLAIKVEIALNRYGRMDDQVQSRDNGTSPLSIRRS